MEYLSLIRSSVILAAAADDCAEECIITSSSVWGSACWSIASKQWRLQLNLWRHTDWRQDGDRDYFIINSKTATYVTSLQLHLLYMYVASLREQILTTWSWMTDCSGTGGDSAVFVDHVDYQIIIVINIIWLLSLVIGLSRDDEPFSVKQYEYWIDLTSFSTNGAIRLTAARQGYLLKWLMIANENSMPK